MKILHTADWHLGKRLDRFSRLEEQKQVLQEICDIADAENVDAVLIAGDLYDSFNPPVEATELFYKTLKTLSRDGRRAVIAIAGNHDSPDRIAAPDPLARECGIILAGYPNAVIPPFALESGLTLARSDAGFIELQLPEIDYPLRLILTPYANEGRLRTFLGFDDTESELRNLLAQQWRQTAEEFCDSKGVNILMTHLFLIPKNRQAVFEEPDDEKPILHVGGLQAIYTENIPAQIQYVALGHLHRRQTIAKKPCPMVYSSSPLSYSFNEVDQDKYVMLLTAAPGKEIEFKEIKLKSGRRLLRKSFEDIKTADAWLKKHPESFVELTLITDDFISQADRKALQQSHDGIVAVIPKIRNAKAETSSRYSAVNLERSLEELFVDYFQQRYDGQQPGKDIMEIFREVLAADEDQDK